MKLQQPSAPQEQTEPRSAQRRARLAYVKASLGIILVDLVLQFILGMYLNLFGSFPTSSSNTGAGMMGNMMSGGGMMTGGPLTMSALMGHMLNGYLLGIISLAVLGLSIYSKSARLIALSIIGTAFIFFAGISGLNFMFSMFSDNLLSFTMATGFIGAFIAYFFELYFTK